MITIIITGPSGSGKSYLANKLSKLFKDSIVINTDSYYRDNLLIKIISILKSDIYDRTLSIKINEIKRDIKSLYKKVKFNTFSKYNFKKKKSSKSSVLINYSCNKQFLIVEGVFSHCLDLDYQNSINIVCKEDKDICYKRRLQRDQLERGRKTTEINKKFNNSWYLFYKNIKIFLKSYKVITLNPADDLTYEKLLRELKHIKKNN